MKTTIAALAAAAAGVFLHRALVQPALIDPHDLRAPFFVQILLGATEGGPTSPFWFRHLNLVLIAAVGLLASGLALLIVLRSEVTAATRRLAAALALAPLSAALEGPRLRDMGPKRLKNVPEPVQCHEIVSALEA